MPVTNGISPKALLAAVVPTLGGVVAVVVQWIATGVFDRAELATACGTVLAASLAFIGAWAGSPGDVTVPDTGVPSDDRLERSVIDRLRQDHGYGLIELLVAAVLAVVLLIVLLKLIERV